MTFRWSFNIVTKLHTSSASLNKWVLALAAAFLLLSVSDKHLLSRFTNLLRSQKVKYASWTNNSDNSQVMIYMISNQNYFGF